MGDLVFWHHAIAAVGAGLATVLGNVQVVDRPAGRLGAPAREAGRRGRSRPCPVVLVGVVLISGVVGADAYGSNPALGVLFGVLTAITYAGFLLVLRAGSTDLRRPRGPALLGDALRGARHPARRRRASASSSCGRHGRSTAGSSSSR